MPVVADKVLILELFDSKVVSLHELSKYMYRYKVIIFTYMF
jgi:hypothetical protein